MHMHMTTCVLLYLADECRVLLQEQPSVHTTGQMACQRQATRPTAVGTVDQTRTVAVVLFSLIHLIKCAMSRSMLASTSTLLVCSGAQLSKKQREAIEPQGALRRAGLSRPVPREDRKYGR